MQTRHWHGQTEEMKCVTFPIYNTLIYESKGNHWISFPPSELPSALYVTEALNCLLQCVSLWSVQKCISCVIREGKAKHHCTCATDQPVTVQALVIILLESLYCFWPSVQSENTVAITAGWRAGKIAVCECVCVCVCVCVSVCAVRRAPKLNLASVIGRGINSQRRAGTDVTHNVNMYLPYTALCRWRRNCRGYMKRPHSHKDKDIFGHICP